LGPFESVPPLPEPVTGKVLRDGDGVTITSGDGKILIGRE